MIYINLLFEGKQIWWKYHYCMTPTNNYLEILACAIQISYRIYINKNMRMCRINIFDAQTNLIRYQP